MYWFQYFHPECHAYTISYFGLTTADLNRLRQAAARFILKRHWLEAEILPYVLRYFGIATLLDPAVSATARQKSVVLALMDLWSPFLGLEELVGAVAAVNGPIPKGLNALKKVIITRMVLKLKAGLPKRCTMRVGVEGSPRWVTLLVEAPRAWCNGVGRYTLLRWAVNQDDDVWLSMRGTGLPGESFPQWLLPPSSLRIMHPLSRSECLGTRPVEAWARDWDIKPAHAVVCRACGCGDNTIGHWTRWRVVPLIVALAILEPTERSVTLDQLACQGPRQAAVCRLILASFRRLLRQEGAFLHQLVAEAKPAQWWIVTLHENVARDAHVQLQVDFPNCQGIVGRCSLQDDRVGVQRILPLDYSTMHLPPVVGICQGDVEANNQLAVLPLSSPVVAAIREMEGAAIPMQSNVQTSIITCRCGDFHVVLQSTSDLCRGDILVPLNTCSPRILVQFDGSAHRTRRVGGAGAALLQVECTGLSLIDWGAQALPNCADNIVAETYGAELAISLYEKYRQLCQQQCLTPLPLDRIQGDIKPLLQRLDF